MTPEQLKVAQPSVFRRCLHGVQLKPLANVVSCGRRHPNHGVWLWLVRDGLAQKIAPTFGEPERFVLTKSGIDAVISAEAQESP